MKKVLVLPSFFIATSFLFVCGALQAAPISMSAPTLMPASLTAGLPPIQKEEHPPGLPDTGQKLEKPPELRPKPLRPADEGISPPEKLPLRERKRPGLAPLPPPPPVQKKSTPAGLPPKEQLP